MEGISTESIRRSAALAGESDGRDAASWLEIADDDDARRKLSMLEDGDPALDEYLPARPNLSGEFADGLTPSSLMGDRIGLIVWNDWEVSEACDAYEEAVSESFESAIETRLRAYLAA